MKFEEKEEIRVCAFIDTLGTSEIFLKNTTGKKHDLLRLIRKLSERKANYSLNTKDLGLGLISSPTPQITTFSDNIAISIPISPLDQDIYVGSRRQRIAFGPDMFASSLISHIISIVWEALRYGILFRGGIVVGNLIHDDHVICGDALVNAAILEKNTKFPRIEVKKEVLELKDNEGKNLFDDFLLNCFEKYDNRFFLDSFGYHELIFMDHNYYQELESKTIQSNKLDILKFYSDKISREYAAIINSGNEKAIENWDWFINNLERKFKTSDLWRSLEQSFDSMFELITHLTQKR